MNQTSTDVRSRLSNAELEELYSRRLPAVQNISRNAPTRFRVVHNHSVGLPNDSSLPLNAFYIDYSRTNKINPAPRQNPMVNFSSTQQHAVGNLGLVNPPVDVQSSHRSVYQRPVGTINAPTMLPNQQSQIAAGYPLYPLTQRTTQDNPRPLFDYSPDEVNWSTYVPFVRNKPNVLGPLIPPRYWKTPVYNPIVNEEAGFYHEMQGMYRHFNSNSADYYNYANRNNSGNEDNNNENKIL